MTTSLRLFLAGLFALALLLLPGTVALAEDPPEAGDPPPAEEPPTPEEPPKAEEPPKTEEPVATADAVAALLARIEEARKAEDLGDLKAAIESAAEVYKATDDTGARSKLRGELLRVVKDEKAGDAREAAVAAFVALEDPKNVWKELSKALPDPKVEEASSVDIAVVDAVGKLAEPKALKPLTDLAQKAKDADLVKAAIEALGGYRSDRKGRVGILEGLLEMGKLVRPS